MSQLSLFSLVEPMARSIPKPAKGHVYCDVLISSFRDEKRRIRVRPLPGQPLPELLVRSAHRARKNYPLGTVFKIDLCLTEGKKGKKFFISRAGRPLQRAIEYFDHNLALQKSLTSERLNFPLP